METVGGFFNAISGGGGVTIRIQTTPTPEQQQSMGKAIAKIDHYPNWKLKKNPFWRVKHPNFGGNNTMGRGASIMPQPQLMQQQQPDLYAYEQHQDIAGIVTLQLAPGKTMEHLGIKIQFIGRIDRSMGSIQEGGGKAHHDFISLSKDLAPPGTLYQSVQIPFDFRNMDKEFESYAGRNICLRYFVKVVVERKFFPPLVKEHDIWIRKLGQPPTQNDAIKMEVGIEDCLHIEFEYERKVYHLHDIILGKIHFLLVRIKIKHMELAVIRRETSGGSSGGNSNNNSTNANANVLTETQTLVKYEIMDGAPVKGEVIPVKLSLKGIPADLTPTYNGVCNLFSVRYFLNLVLVDEEDRRYFKQQEIILWRKELG